jgi:hypothetical protein
MLAAVFSPHFRMKTAYWDSGDPEMYVSHPKPPLEQPRLPAGGGRQGGGTSEGRNPKAEVRSVSAVSDEAVFGFRISTFFRVSGFGLRISAPLPCPGIKLWR